MDGVFFTNPISAIENGAFGTGSPLYGLGNEVPQSRNGGVGRHVEVALFTPGAGNRAFFPNFETPVQSMRGIAITANKFNPVGGQVYVYHSVVNNGLGGLQAGVFDLTPLSLDTEGA